MNDTLKVVRGTYASLTAKIDEYPEFSPCFATDNKDFYIKYQNTLVNVSSGAGVKITSITYSRSDKGIVYYKASFSDGSEIEFPFEVKLDKTSISPGELTRKGSDGTIEGTGVIYNPTLKRYESRYDFKFPSNSIWIGNNVKIGQSGGFVYNHTKSLNKDYIMLDYENNPVSGSKKPIYYKRGALEYNVIIQPDSTEVLQNIQSIDFGKPAYDRQIQAMYFIPEQTITNLVMEFTVNGKMIDHYPSEDAWNGLENGLTLQPNGNVPVRIPMIPFVSNLVEYDVVINFKADSPINLRGKGALPSYGLDLNRITRIDLATMNDIVNVDISDLAKADLSNVNEDSIKDKGFMKTDMEDVDLAKLYDKGIDAKLADGQKVDDIQTEIDRIGNQPKQGDLPTYVFRGNGMPTIPVTTYKAYYIHLVVLRNSLGRLTLPASSQDGIIFSLENNDRRNYVSVYPPSGETINGKAGVYQAKSDTLSFFVKSGKDWIEAFGGVFPNNMDTLRSTIKVLLPNELNTIDEISNQLKDRLHTFAQIQTEFSSQLHTFDSIEEDLVNKGYVKGMRINWGLSETQIPTNNDWLSSNIEPNQKITLSAQTQSKYLLFKVPTTLTPLINGVLVNQTLEELSMIKRENDGILQYVILATSNKIDLSTSKDISLNYKLQEIPVQGIELDDGTDNVSGITKINLENIKIKDTSNSETTLTAGGEITFVDGNTKTEFNSKKIQSLDKSIRIANLDGVADLSKSKTDRNEGIHVALGQNELLNSKFQKSKLYFGDYKVKGGSHIYPNMKNKSFVLQDIDPQDDPNISGGTTFFIAIYYEPNLDLGNKVSQDGTVDVDLVDDNDNPIMDVNGDPMGVRIDYKTGDIGRSELYVGECQIKGYTEVHPKIKLNFVNEEIISVGSNTQICIQSISKDESGGPALDSFMLYTGYRFSTNIRYYGLNSMNLARALIFPETETDTGENNMIDFGNNLYFNSVSNSRISILNNTFNVSDDGVNLPVWSIGKYYDKLDSHYISGKNYKITAKLQDKDSSFNISLLQYKGTDFIPPKPIVLSYNNGEPVFTSGWAKVDNLFISEDVVTGLHVISKDFTIPNNSVGVAFLMYPSSSIPTNLKLKDLEGDITPWFNKVVITDNAHISEKYLLSNKQNYKFVVATPSGILSYRYTVNALDTKLPIGVVSGGDGKVINDNSWTDIGSYDPNKTQGDFKFLTDGRVNMRYTTLAKNEQSTANDVNFKLVKVNVDGTFTDVQTSIYNGTIEATRLKALPISHPRDPKEKFYFDVNINDTYRFVGKSNKDDGFYLQSTTDGIPLIKFEIEFDEITAEEKNILDKINLVDSELVITPEAIAHGVYMELGWENGKPVLKQKVRGEE